MRELAVFLTVLGAVCGFVGAWHWYKASKVPLDVKLSPSDQISEDFQFILAIGGNLRAAARRNKKGAIWTAAAVILTGLASIAGTF